MDKLKKLEQVLTNKNWQKFCTGEDWFDPAFKFIIKNIFNKNSSYTRKQWEFVVIFLSLFIKGKLNKESNGASFGAGKEPLIYDLLPYVSSLFATDLYSMTTGWDTAKTKENESPLQFIKNNAPSGLSTDNLQVAEMDMRYLDIDDNSLDFCYSSCAIEHIGHKQDFIQHFKEVARVLKSDGVYVVTTELLFGYSTKTNKHNYKFAIEDLKEIFIESGLDTEPLFDATCEESQLNKPRSFIRPLMGSENLKNIFIPATILEFEGVPYTSCNFILTPSKVKPKSFAVNGLEASCNFIYKKMKNNMTNMYACNRTLNPFHSLMKQNRTFLDDHMQFRSTESFIKPKVKLIDPKFCFTDFIWFEDNQAKFDITFKLNGYVGIVMWFLIEKEQLNGRTRRVIKKKLIHYNSESNLEQSSFIFTAKKNRVYAVRGQVSLDLYKKGQVKLAIDYLHVSTQLTGQTE